MSRSLFASLACAGAVLAGCLALAPETGAGALCHRATNGAEKKSWAIVVHGGAGAVLEGRRRASSARARNRCALT